MQTYHNLEARGINCEGILTSAAGCIKTSCKIYAILHWLVTSEFNCLKNYKNDLPMLNSERWNFSRGFHLNIRYEISHLCLYVQLTELPTIWKSFLWKLNYFFAMSHFRKVSLHVKRTKSFRLSKLELLLQAAEFEIIFTFYT